mgnify:CR=1 FL=1
MPNSCLGCGIAAFQHFLDQIDPATGTVEFVTKGYIGWTRRRAKSAMNAFAQDIIGLGDTGVLQLRI